MPQRYLAIDFETYYDDEYSIRGSSPWGYVHDERFDAYLVALHNDTISWVGDPKQADWSLCHGAYLVAHTAGFDSMVFKRCQELGIIPADIKPLGWYCTADMAAYLRCKRDLATAARILLERPRSKKTRTNMKGKTYADAVAAGMEEELLQYGGDDARDCWDLWVRYSDQWPESEQETSRIIREGTAYGIQTDYPKVEAGIKLLRQKRDEALAKIPWADSHEDKPLSAAKAREQGRIDGIPVPSSFSATNPDAQEWETEYAEQFPWVAAIRDYRRLNTFYQKLVNMDSGIGPDGVYRFSCKYAGAHTGRTSGGSQYEEAGGKFNIQNLPRDPLFGVDFRDLLIARPKHKLVVADLAQIEARYLLWLVGDTQFLEVLKQEGNLYQAYAKMRGWYSGSNLKKEDPGLYQRTKATVLSLGYQSGWAKFRHVAKMQYGVDFSEDEAKQVVSEYRASNPKIVQHWYNHHAWLKISVQHQDPTHEVVLKSGRILTYYNPGIKHGEIVVSRIQGEPPHKYYGGKLCENEIQASCRDIICDGRIAIEKARPEHRCLFDAHDELVVEIPDDCADERAAEVARLMTTSSPWAEGCPIEAEYAVVDRYFK